MLDYVRHQLGRLIHRISEFGAAVIWPIERSCAAVARSVLAASESADLVGGFFGRISRWLTWPVRAVWRTTVAMAATLLPEALRDRVAKVG